VVITLSFTWFRSFYIARSIQKSKPLSQIIKTSNASFFNKFHKIFPYSALTEAKGALANRITIKRIIRNTKNFRFHAFKKDTLEIGETYVLVIGETNRSQSWQLYGYERATNPYLSKVENLCLFSNFLSSANFTDLSLSLILSRATPDSFYVSYKEKNIIAAFKEAGFMTYWISNQGIFNDDLERLVIDADKVYNMNSRFDYSGCYDENIFPFLDSVILSTYQRKFVVIHLLGSHFQYHYRYPEKFEVFNPGFDNNFTNLMINPDNKDRLVNTYDNSILYTDFILSQVIKKIKASDNVGLIMYISDHGENLYDDTNEYFAHGLENPTKYEVIIPFFVWYSGFYGEYYPEKINRLRLNNNKRTSTTNLFYSLLDAANISYDNEKPGKSFFNPDFIEDTVRKVIVPSRKVVVFDKK
jgi:glucan phosphoethanolaminetransferase (alkaline phosphatase superfamily)